MVGREADDPAGAACRFDFEQRINGSGREGRVCGKRGKIVGKHIGSRVVGIVLSGDAAGLAAAGALLKEKGAKTIPLKVSVANHSPLVAGAVPDFAESMSKIDFQAPAIPVLFNVSAGLERNPVRIREFMAYQIASKVRWLEIIEAMLADGVELFVELGPKNVLTGMVKKIAPKDAQVLCLQADTPEAMDAVASAITG